MFTRDYKKAKFLALAALMASGASLAGCSATIGANTGVNVGATNTDTGSATVDGSQTSSYEVSCRRGIVNDPYPGLCREYVDADDNGICDLSEPSQSDVSQSTVLTADSDDASLLGLDGGCPLAPCVVCGICANLG